MAHTKLEELPIDRLVRYVPIDRRPALAFDFKRLAQLNQPLRYSSPERPEGETIDLTVTAWCRRLDEEGIVKVDLHEEGIVTKQGTYTATGLDRGLGYYLVGVFASVLLAGYDPAYLMWFFVSEDGNHEYPPVNCWRLFCGIGETIVNPNVVLIGNEARAEETLWSYMVEYPVTGYYSTQKLREGQASARLLLDKFLTQTEAGRIQAIALTLAGLGPGVSEERRQLSSLIELMCDLRILLALTNFLLVILILVVALT